MKYENMDAVRDICNEIDWLTIRLKQAKEGEFLLGWVLHPIGRDDDFKIIEDKELVAQAKKIVIKRLTDQLEALHTKLAAL